jgi:hypothetical protein
MIHPHASSPPRPAGRSIPRTRRMITTIGGLAAFLAAAIGLAPAASATLPPPEPSVVPVPSPPPLPAAPAHFPPWAVAAMVGATIVLSVATTLITLALEHLRRTRRTPAAATEPQAGVPTPANHGRTRNRTGRDPQQPPAPGRLRHVPGRQPLKE